MVQVELSERNNKQVKADKARDAVTGSAVLAGIGHSTSLLLLAGGIGGMLLGYSIIEDANLITIIFGGSLIVGGALVTSVTIGTWLFALAMQFFGRGTVGWTVAMLVLALFLFSLWV